MFTSIGYEIEQAEKCGSVQKLMSFMHFEFISYSPDH